MTHEVIRTLADHTNLRQEQAKSIQKMMLDLVEMSTFNSFDGKKVRADLEAIRDRWEACMMTRDGDCGITLRDLSDGVYNVDTLYILTSRKNVAAVMKLAKTWKADHITKITSDGHYGASRWDSDDDSYKFHKIKSEKTDVSYILGSWGPGKDSRAIIRLWWD